METYTYLMALQFLVVVIFSNLFFVALYQNSKNRLNQAFASLVASFLWWGVAMIFLWNPNISKESAAVADKIGSLGWISFHSFLLWFILVFTEKKALLKKKMLYAVIFFIPLVLVAREWLAPFSLLTKSVYGWISAWDGSFWTYLYLSYYIVFFSIDLYLLFKYLRQTKTIIRKKQALIIIISTLIIQLGGTVSDWLLPLLKGPMPSLTNFFFLAWSSGMFYAITKYRLFNLSFSLANKNIINNMSESLLLLDKDGRIMDINDRAVKFLQFGKMEILDHKVAEYFSSEIAPKILKAMEDRGEIESLDTEIRLKDGLFAPVLFSCSVIKDEDNNFLGWVCMIGDISRQKRDEADLAARNKELSEKLAELQRFQKIVVDRELKMIELKEEIDHLRRRSVAPDA